jgi:hypothetical protein
MKTDRDSTIPLLTQNLKYDEYYKIRIKKRRILKLVFNICILSAAYPEPKPQKNIAYI